MSRARTGGLACEYARGNAGFCDLQELISMTLELDIWREVSRHHAIEDFLEQVQPYLFKRYRWVQGIALLSVSEAERSSRCVAAIGAQANVWRSPVARDLSEDALFAYREWHQTRHIVAWHQVPAPLRPLLGAVGTERPFAMVQLSDTTGNEGILVLTGSTTAPPVNLKQLLPLREPFTQAMRNDRHLRALQRRNAASEADRRALLERLGRDTLDSSIVGADTGLRDVMSRVDAIANGNDPVLILAEPGAGKEVFARALHTRSLRVGGPLIRVNCNAVPSSQIDAELFGCAQETGPDADKEPPGAFERADGGTLFLDEVSALPLATQLRLLRILQDGTFQRVGDERTLRTDVRVVASTQRDLLSMVRAGAFREDLWYRLNVTPLQLPSLRGRPEDIGHLAQHFADRAGRRLGGLALRLLPSDIALLQNYDWPGNTRELAIVVERAVLLGDGRRLAVPAALGLSLTPGEVEMRASASTSNQTTHHGTPAPELRPHRGTLDDAIIDRIHETLRRTGGMIEGKYGAAAILGVNPSTLRSRMRKLDISWEKYRQPTSPNTEK